LHAEATFDRGAEAPWSHPVLALLSEGYPGLEGRLPTCYSPVRRFTHGVAPAFSRDLHVLGTPPAFVLSQDQTLQLNSEPRRAFWRIYPAFGLAVETRKMNPRVAFGDRGAGFSGAMPPKDLRCYLVFKDPARVGRIPLLRTTHPLVNRGTLFRALRARHRPADHRNFKGELWRCRRP
jgi:hypothetical protein